MLSEEEIKEKYLELYDLKEKYMSFINDPNIKLHTELYYLEKVKEVNIKLQIMSEILWPYDQ